MSGHSKWSTIKRAKGAADIKRGMTFTKLANAITIAAKTGGSGDPNFNPRLRMALEQAKTVNLPKDNIQRAIDRGLGKLPGQILEEINYEGFGPGKVAFILEAVTDNKLRTLQVIKNLFERSGGALASTGSALYMFDRVGEIKTIGKGDRRDDEILELIDLGAEDVEDFQEDGVQKYVVSVGPSILSDVTGKLKDAGFTVEQSQLIFKPNITVEIKDKQTAQKILEFSEKLESNDDIQQVFSNFDIDESLI